MCPVVNLSVGLVQAVSASDLETCSLPWEVGWIDLSILTQLCCDCGSAKQVPMNNPLGLGLCIDF